MTRNEALQKELLFQKRFLNNRYLIEENFVGETFRHLTEIRHFSPTNVSPIT